MKKWLKVVIPIWKTLLLTLQKTNSVCIGKLHTAWECPVLLQPQNFVFLKVFLVPFCEMEVKKDYVFSNKIMTCVSSLYSDTQIKSIATNNLQNLAN